MANIREKDIEDLSTWNLKELRKLRINLKNRIESLSFSAKAKELKEGHPLAGKELGECQELLAKILKAEKIQK